MNKSRRSVNVVKITRKVIIPGSIVEEFMAIGYFIEFMAIGYFICALIAFDKIRWLSYIFFGKAMLDTILAIACAVREGVNERP